MIKKCEHIWVFHSYEETGLGEYYYCQKCLAEGFISDLSGNRKLAITEVTEEGKIR